MEEVNGWDRMDSMFYRPLHPRGYWRSLLWAVTVRAKGVLDYVWSPPAHVVAWWRAVQFAETLVLRVRVIRRYAQRCSVPGSVASDRRFVRTFESRSGGSRCCIF